MPLGQALFENVCHSDNDNGQLSQRYSTALPIGYVNKKQNEFAASIGFALAEGVTADRSVTVAHSDWQPEGRSRPWTFRFNLILWLLSFFAITCLILLIQRVGLSSFFMNDMTFSSTSRSNNVHSNSSDFRFHFSFPVTVKEKLSEVKNEKHRVHENEHNHHDEKNKLSNGELSQFESSLVSLPLTASDSARVALPLASVSGAPDSEAPGHRGSAASDSVGQSLAVKCGKLMKRYGIVPYGSLGGANKLQSEKKWWWAAECDALMMKQKVEEWRKQEASDETLRAWKEQTKKREEEIAAQVTLARRAERRTTAQQLASVTIVVARFRDDVTWLTRFKRSNRFHFVIAQRPGSTALPMALNQTKTVTDWNSTVQNDNLRAPLPEYSVEHLNLLYNYADEATVYLEYIVKHYDDPPSQWSDWVAFVHGSERSTHHEGSLVDLLEHWNYGAQSYMEINLEYGMSCAVWNWTEGIVHPRLKAIWQKVFLPLGWPSPIDRPYCFHAHAQFIVSRERILANPKEIYLTYLKYLHEHYGPGSAAYREGQEKRGGRVMAVNTEGSWHALFRQPFLVQWNSWCDVINCEPGSQREEKRRKLDLENIEFE